MATGDLLKRLFRSYKQLDQEGFYAAAMEIIQEEQQKNHHLLAQDLQRILDNGKSKGRPINTTHVFDLQKLPKDRERGTILLDLRTPQRLLNDIVLGDDLQTQVEDAINEYNKSAILKTYGLSPKSKLLFTGPPGCGKTLCAEVFASELGLPLLYTRFDAVISSYLGETAANLRKVFDFAASGTWVVFFDEFDAIGKSRDDLTEHGELKRVVNTFLQLLDGFESDSIFIAATNHEHILDSALWRRFDDILYFDRPTAEQIEKLLHLKLRGFRHRTLDTKKYISRMLGWSYADVERVCTDAIKLAVLSGQDELREFEFDTSLKRQERRAFLIGKKQE